MKIELNLPKPEISHSVNGFWLRSIFGDFPTENWKVNALTSTFVSLAQNAASEYEQACAYAEDFYINSRGRGGLSLGSMHMMARRYENVISNTHRSIGAFSKLRGHRDAPQKFRDHLNANRPAFLSNGFANRVRAMRNAVHHMDEMVGTERLRQGQPLHVLLSGLETPVQCDDQPNQTLMVFDRLTLGTDVILLSELCECLNEMGRQAEYICTYGASSAPPDTDLPPGAQVITINIRA